MLPNLIRGCVVIGMSAKFVDHNVLKKKLDFAFYSYLISHTSPFTTARQYLFEETNQERYYLFQLHKQRALDKI